MSTSWLSFKKSSSEEVISSVALSVIIVGLAASTGSHAKTLLIDEGAPGIYVGSSYGEG